MAVVWPPPRRTGAFITFAMVKFASPLPEHLQDLQATEHQGVGLACGSPGEADVDLRHGRLLLLLHCSQGCKCQSRGEMPIRPSEL
ncbi:hypothetical protein SRHO_G00120670 [Serrasalmus rhombeus]